MSHSGTTVALSAVDEPEADAHAHFATGAELDDFVPLTLDAAQALTQAAALDGLAERAQRHARLPDQP